jgi:WD40 repeat protein
LHRYDPQDITINSNINFAKPISYGKKQIKEVGEIWKRSKNILQFFMNLRNLKNSVAFYDKYNIVIQEDKKTIGLYLKTTLMSELVGHEEDIISIDIDDITTTLISADSSGIVKLWDLNNLTEKIIYPTLNLTFVNNTDWVIWNNNYQYVSSAKGGNILGFFENGKQYRASKFHNLDTFKKTLFNKDEIVKLLPKL